MRASRRSSRRFTPVSPSSTPVIRRFRSPMSSRMSCTPRSRRRRYCRIRLSGSLAMSRLGKPEAQLDPIDRSVTAIQPPVHAEQPLLHAQNLAPEFALTLLDPGPQHSPLSIIHVNSTLPAVEQ